ncbi:MAG: hypothetical protein RMY16_21985 [Nostoc sp. DedQUE12b]|uniref:hypothetical protein n=1 Tax=unclassified Nostoc TaxID=2593658 RepID=UPI002AD22C28|nr:MULTISPECIES: hypothetical protein [unclassified Nostoc]MDZ7950233.1 hypothetical protein [Nostoc sp. DedQUE09]MDZ8088205.1 hypothetical protein [Nostoc sp. DedQUE12b]
MRHLSAGRINLSVYGSTFQDMGVVFAIAIKQKLLPRSPTGSKSWGSKSSLS